MFAWWSHLGFFFVHLNQCHMKYLNLYIVFLACRDLSNACKPTLHTRGADSRATPLILSAQDDQKD